MNKREKFLLYFVVLFVIIPGGISFFIKIVSYFMVGLEEGMSGFALPFINYLFIAMGFVFLFVWAYLRGHFEDIEKPAHDMLERNAMYDEIEERGGKTQI